MSPLASIAKLPKQLWRVSLTLPVIKWGETKTFANEEPARRHLAKMRARGVGCNLYTTSTDWKLIDQQPELEGQEELF
jgi:hypothetical protein